MNLEQLRKQAKELARAARTGDPEALARIGDLPLKLASAQTVLAREQGFASWPALVHELAEQPFRTDLEYYEGRAEGIATVNGVPLASARRDLAQRHGYSSWAGLTRHVDCARERRGACDAVHAGLPRGRGRRARPAGRAARRASRARRHARNERQRPARDGRRPGEREAVARAWGGRQPRQRLRLDEAPPGGLLERPQLAELVLRPARRTDLSARGDGGTPLVAALFWGHREVVDLLGLEPRNLRVAAGVGRVDLIDELVGTPAAGAHRAFYRPHGGFPAWQPSDDPQEIVDEALVWAAKADRVEAIDRLVELGARRRGGSLSRHTARLGRGERAGSRDPPAGRARCRPERPGHVRRADPRRGCAAAPPRRTVGAGGRGRPPARARADPTVRDRLYDGDAAGWAAHGCRPDLADRLE